MLSTYGINRRMSQKADQDLMRAKRLAALNRSTAGQSSDFNMSRDTSSMSHDTSSTSRDILSTQSQSINLSDTVRSTTTNSFSHLSASESTPSYNPFSSSPANKPGRESGSNIHTLSSLKSSSGGGRGGGSKLASNCRTQTITDNNELYVGLPSFSITSEQLVEFIRVQFGVKITVRYMNKNKKNDGKERNFCFIECDNKGDMEYLLEQLHDSTIGEWDNPITCHQKKDRE